MAPAIWSRFEILERLRALDASQREGRIAARIITPAKAPLKQLPPTLTLFDADGTRKPNVELPRLYFAIGVTCEQILQYAWRTNLTPHTLCKPGTIAQLAAFEIDTRLTELCKTTITCQIPSQGPFVYVFSLYTNLTPPKKRPRGQHERDAIATIQRELDITEAPQWYFACEESSKVRYLDCYIFTSD